MKDMIKGWAIYPMDNGDNAFGWMKDSAEKNGITLDIIFAKNISVLVASTGIKILQNGEECALPHFVLMRHYDVNLSSALELLGVRVINSTSSMELSRNKLMTHLALHDKGVNTPLTISGDLDYNMCASTLGSPFIVKAIQGSKGEEVFLIDNEMSYNEVRHLHSEVIMQRNISSSFGRDIRVWVVGGEVVASILRYNMDSFKSNIALGGKAESYEISDEVGQLAVAACEAVGLELAGVDILFEECGYTVCEINGNAGFRAFGMARVDVDIPNSIFRYVRLLFSGIN